MKAPIIFPDILLPAKSVAMKTWPVIACDQFTADEEYWKSVEQTVGDRPSTLNLVLPEIYLDRPGREERERRIRRTMREYLDEGVFQEIPKTAVFVRRTLSTGGLRRGVVVAVDLEQYDFDPEQKSIIRASEETIPDRLPPRAAIRNGAPLESPHVLVLFDDPDDTVMTQLDENRLDLTKLYDTPLMNGGGSVEGYAVPEGSAEANALIAGLESLTTIESYGYLFATGDGNHSLAAAKTVWTARKREGAPPDDPYRYCLVELVNVYDRGLPFHPIHRLVEGGNGAEGGGGDAGTGGTEKLFLDRLISRTGGSFSKLDRDALVTRLNSQGLTSQEVGVIGPERCGIVRLGAGAKPTGGELAVAVTDEAIAASSPGAVDYIHGLEEVITAASTRNGIAVILPEIDRSGLFSTVATKGTLPRKAFSLGEARDKRYYLECRRLERN
ncbi:MAG: DUF1015 domain-containing protein [Alkalispirochaeta sp.]